METMEEELMQKEEKGEQQSFDHFIESEQDFNLMLVTSSDDSLISLYHYLLEKEKQLSEADRTEDGPTLDRVTDMISRLKEIPAIRDHHEERTITPEEQDEIDETVTRLEEKRMARDKGPFRRFIDNLKR